MAFSLATITSMHLSELVGDKSGLFAEKMALNSENFNPNIPKTVQNAYFQ